MYKDTLETATVLSLSRKPENTVARAEALDQLLTGNDFALGELPPLADLIAGTLELIAGTRQRVLLPLAGLAAEFALVRDGQHVLVDCYGTESTPEIWLRARRIRLIELQRACHAAAVLAARRHESPTMARALSQLAQRVQAAEMVSMPTRAREVVCTGGSLESPGRNVPLSFGFSTRIRPAATARAVGRDFADVHALLFEGELWGFAGETRIMLARGPIMLAAQRMAAAVRLLLEAWQVNRDMHVRLRSGAFGIGVRLADGSASLDFTANDGRKVSLRNLSVPELALPILRLCADLLRKLVSVDRSQMRNLRVVSLRHEIRTLRRIVRTRDRNDGFENSNPDRLRLSTDSALPLADEQLAGPRPMPGRLRYTERWSAEVEGLDAGNVFLCGKQLIVGTPKMTIALCRSTGEVNWSQPNDRSQTVVVGRMLLSVSSDGDLRLTDISDGQVYARSHLSSRFSGVPVVQFGGGGDLPPTAILTDGLKYLWSVDLRTGEMRYRYRARGGAGIQLRRAGRVLLVTSGDGSIDALDIASGEVVWRHCAGERFCLPPAVVDNVVLAASGEPGGGAARLFGIDLFTGRELWQSELPAAPSSAPIATTHAVVIPCGGSKNAKLVAVAPRDGKELFSCHDPGIDNGGQAIEVDGQLIVNTPRGRVLGLDLTDGSTRWSQALSNPLTDDVPRGLAPRLRQGALFVPSAQVHVLRPSDGVQLTASMPCDLIPDFMQVDEQSHLFVAEESGHLRAYAPAPHLTLVK